MRFAFVYCFLTGYILTACQEPNSAIETTTEPISKQTVVIDSTSPQNALDTLIALYPSYKLPLQLSTESLNKDSNLKNPLVQGKLIPNRLTSLFGELFFTEGNDAFAIAKLQLPNQKIGLITRVLGEYVSSRILLIIFDLQSSELIDSYELSEAIGDGGSEYVRTSNINWDFNKKLSITTSQHNCWPIQPEDLEHIVCVDSTIVYRFANNRFNLVSRKANK